MLNTNSIRLKNTANLTIETLNSFFKIQIKQTLVNKNKTDFLTLLFQKKVSMEEMEKLARQRYLTGDKTYKLHLLWYRSVNLEKKKIRRPIFF